MILVLSLIFNVIWASTNGKLYKCAGTADPTGTDPTGTYCVFAVDTDECSADATLNCLTEPLEGNKWINIPDVELGKAMVANAAGAMKAVSPQPWTEGDQLVATSDTITGDNWAAALAFSMVGPLRQKLMVTPWELYDDAEWDKYTKAFTDCLVKTSDGNGNDLSSASVKSQLNTATDGGPTHTYLQYLEEAAIDLVCLMTDLDMDAFGGRRKLSDDRCGPMRDQWGISIGTKCDCWKDAYVGIYGSDPLVEENQFSDCSVVGSTTSNTETTGSTDGGNTGGGSGPTCCDGSSPACADGSTTFPCSSGSPICDDGSNALAPGSSQSCPETGTTAATDATTAPETTPSTGTNYDVAWTAGFADPSARAMEAAVGDTLTFTWGGTHNVYLMPDEDALNGCDFSNAELQGDTTGLTVTITATPMYFACMVYGHCGQGQILAVTAAAQETDAPEESTEEPDATTADPATPDPDASTVEPTTPDPTSCCSDRTTCETDDVMNANGPTGADCATAWAFQQTAQGGSQTECIEGFANQCPVTCGILSMCPAESTTEPCCADMTTCETDDVMNANGPTGVDCATAWAFQQTPSGGSQTECIEGFANQCPVTCGIMSMCPTESTPEPTTPAKFILATSTYADATCTGNPIRTTVYPINLDGSCVANMHTGTGLKYECHLDGTMTRHHFSDYACQTAVTTENLVSGNCDSGVEFHFDCATGGAPTIEMPDSPYTTVTNDIYLTDSCSGTSFYSSVKYVAPTATQNCIKDPNTGTWERNTCQGQLNPEISYSDDQCTTMVGGTPVLPWISSCSPYNHNGANLFLKVVTTCPDAASIGETAMFDTLTAYPGSAVAPYNGTFIMSFTGTSVIINYVLNHYDERCDAGPGTAGNSCGIHIHAGTSCATNDDVGGHYYTPNGDSDADPWSAIAYGPYSFGTQTVDYGYDWSQSDGHVLVLHDYEGARITCDVIGTPIVCHNTCRTCTGPAATDCSGCHGGYELNSNTNECEEGSLPACDSQQNGDAVACLQGIGADENGAFVSIATPGGACVYLKQAYDCLPNGVCDLDPNLPAIIHAAGAGYTNNCNGKELEDYTAATEGAGKCMAEGGEAATEFTIRGDSSDIACYILCSDDPTCFGWDNQDGDAAGTDICTMYHELIQGSDVSTAKQCWIKVGGAATRPPTTTEPTTTTTTTTTPTDPPPATKQLKFGLTLDMTADKFNQEKTNIETGIANKFDVAKERVSVAIKDSRRALRRVLTTLDLEVTLETTDEQQSTVTAAMAESGFADDLATNINQAIPGDETFVASNVETEPTVTNITTTTSVTTTTSASGANTDDDDSSSNSTTIIIIVVVCVVAVLAIVAFACNSMNKSEKNVGGGEFGETELADADKRTPGTNGM